MTVIQAVWGSCVVPALTTICYGEGLLLWAVCCLSLACRNRFPGPKNSHSLNCFDYDVVGKRAGNWSPLSELLEGVRSAAPLPYPTPGAYLSLSPIKIPATMQHGAHYQSMICCTSFGLSHAWEQWCVNCYPTNNWMQTNPWRVAVFYIKKTFEHTETNHQSRNEASQ